MSYGDFYFYPYRKKTTHTIIHKKEAESQCFDLFLYILSN